VPSASSIRHKPSSWDCASIGNVKQRHRKDTLFQYSRFLSTPAAASLIATLGLPVEEKGRR